ncbi:MAG: repair protein RadA, DNA repair protein RadA/Sms protein [Candidatus Peregrinibacteria bacterium GW2011_GWF2_33_10]|nr:MAG: repair protein RadA, DNA repair protein RadA/Sms protein [Candidatus Peregrinibacteria bacterium GW2011_GWF2_33_10]
MKLKTIYICETCKYESQKWAGKCPECNAWNSFVEDAINVGKDDFLKNLPKARIHQPLNINLSENFAQKVKTGINEFDNVLGGGIVKGSLTILGGEPGIGKSTLILQICQKLCAQNQDVFYISGEESIDQISMRANRLNINHDKLKLINSNNLEEIIATLLEHKPDLAIIDSIQVMASDVQDSSSGSISQIRFVTEKLMDIAKNKGITVILIGHVTKDGVLAGPKALEHLVDTVLNLEGDRYHELRILRAYKNRFGSTSEIGIFEMDELGLKEVKNPSQKMIESRQKNAIGSCLSMAIEGNRPLLIEVQALTNLSVFGYPKRTASGFDTNRLDILVAVLQKHAGINLTNQDIYVNIVGGIKIKDPAIDLAVCLAIISSFKKNPLPENLVAIGEIGLCGEIRKTNQYEKRLKEVQNLGFKLNLDSKLTKISEVINKIF